MPDPATPYEWAQAKRSELPSRPNDTGKTTGIYRDKNGSDQRIESGRDGSSTGINDHIFKSAKFPSFPSGAFLDVAIHAETKLAWRMRRDGQKRGSIVINNRMCDNKPSMKASKWYTCRRAIRAILPRGYRLEVWEPDSTEPIVISGVSDE